MRIKRTDLLPEVSQQTFERMRAERLAEAAQLRARGTELAARIRAEADREAVVTVAEAQREAEILRGQGEAERSRVFAEAYSANTDFFEFYRSMRAYQAALDGTGTTLVLSPDSEFFRFFRSPDGLAAPAADADAAGSPRRRRGGGAGSGRARRRPARSRGQRRGGVAAPEAPATAEGVGGAPVDDPAPHGAMTDVPTAVGLVLALEGALYALFPGVMKRMAAQVIADAGRHAPGRRRNIGGARRRRSSGWCAGERKCETPTLVLLSGFRARLSSRSAE